MKTSKVPLKMTGTVLGTAAAATGALIFALAPGKSDAGQRGPFYGRYFAHRGLHTTDGSAPENSLTAFRMAANVGYGVELDVHLTRDGEVAVFHDHDLLRMTGSAGSIEDRTYAELRELRLAGSGEQIPLLSEVLEILGGVGPVILELKPGSRLKELCAKVAEELAEYPGDVCVECFDPRVLFWFRRHAPEYLRGQLAMPMGHYEGEVSRPLAFLLSHGLLNFLGRPQFIAYELGPKPLTIRLAETLGAMRVCWTSRSLHDKKDNEAVIFEHYRPDLYL